MSSPLEQLPIHLLWATLLVPKPSLLQRAVAQLWLEPEPKLYLPLWLSKEKQKESQGPLCELSLESLQENFVEQSSLGGSLALFVDLDPEGWLFLKKLEKRSFLLIEKLLRLFREKKEGPFVESTIATSLRPKQCEAVEMALQTSLFVLTGGPGTGKTYTCRCLVETILRCDKSRSFWRVALLAPTGKAVMRLQESLEGIEQSLPCLCEAMTLHRFLKDSDRLVDLSLDPAPYDILLVDEASMITVDLLEALLEKRASQTRLVFIGDPDQLPPVGSMPLFRTLVDLAGEAGCSTHLEEALRSERPLLQRAAETLSLARTSDQRASFPSLFSTSSKFSPLKQTLFSEVEELVEAFLETSPWCSFLKKREKKGLDSPQETPYIILEALKETICLCSLQVSEFGSDRVNQEIYARLRLESMRLQSSLWIPVMATVNQKELARVNGEIGVMRLEPEIVRATHTVSKALLLGTELVFPSPSGRKQLVSPLRLEALAPSWAITVHKSQGSEFDHVELLFSSSESDQDLALLYTACTRAKKSLHLWTREGNWIKALVPHKSYDWMERCKNKVLYRNSKSRESFL